MLRFKRDDGTSYPEWEKKSLSKLFTPIRNGFVGTVTEHFCEKECGVPYVEGTHIHDGKINIIPELFVSKEFNEKHSNSCLKKDDIVMVQSGHVGECAVVGETYNGGNCHALIILSRTKKVDPLFYIGYFYSDFGRRAIQYIQTGNTVKHILASEIKKIQVPVPCLEEQQKIADFLSEVDNIIAMSEQEIESLEMQKKGAMQKIFSQEVRFKADDGSEYPEWEEKALQDIAKIKMGQSPDSSSYNDNLEGVPLIQGNADMLNRVTAPQKYTNSPTKLCEVGDLIMTVRAPVGYIGKSIYRACIGRGVCALTAYENSEYLYQYFMYIENTWKKIEQGSTFTAISGKDLNKMKAFTPCLEEQQKIADLLSEFDNAIEYAKKELEVWKNIKKGLLQQMFE